MSSASTLCGGPVGGCRRARPDARVLLLAVFAMGVCLLAISVAPALAVRGHVFEREFGGPGSGDGQFAEPGGVAVSEATGDVYVADKGDSRIEFFNEKGEFQGQFNGSGAFPNEEGRAAPEPLLFEGGNGAWGSVAVDSACALHKPALTEATTPKCGEFDPSNGDVYVPTGEFNEMKIDKFSATGAFIGQLVVPLPPGASSSGVVASVAVDPRGELWVLSKPSSGGTPVFVDSFSNAAVNEFEQARGLARPIPQDALAVDSSDDFFLAEDNGGLDIHEIFEYAAGGAAPSRSTGELPGQVSEQGLAADPATGELYVEDHASFERLGPDLALIERVALQGENGRGIAVNSASGRVYVSDAVSDRVGVYELEPPAVPVVREQAASGVTSSSASLSGEVNPRSETGEPQTASWFEYTSLERFTREGWAGATKTPVSELEATYDASRLSTELEGLTAGTTYRYRLVASNALGVTEGETSGKGEELVRSFTTQSPGVFPLPDERGWELVSPPAKLGAALFGLGAVGNQFATQAAADGGVLTYVASAPTEDDALGNGGATQVFSWRSPGGGWSSRDLSVPHEQATALTEHPEYPLFSTDLSLAALQPLGGFIPCTSEGLVCLSGQASEQTAFLRSNFPAGSPGAPCVLEAGTDCYRPLVTGAGPFANVPAGTVFGVKEGGRIAASQACPPNPFCGPQFEAASPDLSHVVLNSQAELTVGSGASPEGLFEFSGATGALAFIGHGQVGAGRAGEANNSLTASAHAVSTDGSRVIFNGESPDGRRGLLLRDTASEETLRLAGSQAVFLMASSDGSRVFFTSDTGGPLEECEILEGEGGLQCNATGKPLDLTPGGSILAPIPGASEDGSYVYFASGSVLTGEPNARGETAGECPGGPQQHCTNLYVLHEGTIRLVAVLSGNDSPDWGHNSYLQGGRNIVSPNAAVSALTARVSSDGRWLAFMSERSLTGYDNLDVKSGRPDEEVFLYDAASARVLCASCNPTGGRPSGVTAGSLANTPDAGFSETWPEQQGLAASVPGWSNILYQSRYLSNGGRVFFDSADALVPQDTNNAEDVYQWEPALGAGIESEGAPVGDTCTPATPGYEPASQGCVALLSGGDSSAPSGFLDASENGGDVFFLTAAPLSKRDLDTSYDIYDARINGGEPPIPVPPVCVGDSCQPTVAPPLALTLPTLTLASSGNFAPLETKQPPKPKPETRAQKLAKALNVCRKLKSRPKRARCERAAHKKFGPAKKAKKAKR